MNTSQVCRTVHNRDKNNLEFCRGTEPRKIVEFRKDSYFHKKGGPYPNCHNHNPVFPFVYRQLRVLERKHLIKSVRMRFRDPQKKGREWDTMRFWGIDLTPILKQTMPFYLLATGEGK